MKFYYPKDKNGNRIGFKTPESQVYDTNGRSLTDKLTELNSNISSLNSNFENRYDAYRPNVVTDLNLPLSADGSTFAVNFFNNIALNKPSSGSGCVLTWSSSAAWGAQFGFTDTGVFWRKNSNGTISDWKTIIN